MSEVAAYRYLLLVSAVCLLAFPWTLEPWLLLNGVFALFFAADLATPNTPANGEAEV